MIYFCCDERRRNLVKSQKTLNGIDFLEVSDDPVAPYEQRQRTLLVYFIHDLTPDALTKANVRIDGGERIRNIKVTDLRIGGISSPPASPPATEQANLLVVQVAAPGDYSTYTLRLVKDNRSSDPPAGFDPMLSGVDFSFKVACPSDFDCLKERICPRDSQPPPEINYLAKDYATFRQSMLDRMAVLMPQWQERNAADLGIALVELLAYVGDYLSYQQDAIATEAYLGTARQRTSVRRHARLVDYPMHEGCNARVWVHLCLRSDIDALLLKKGAGRHTTKLLTRIDQQHPVIAMDSSSYENALVSRPEIFECMHDKWLYAAHNTMRFYTWSERHCCIPKGAIRATLRGDFPNLKAGDVLILEEVRGSQTGKPEDADPAHRHAVRLTKVELSNDPLGQSPLDSPPSSSPIEPEAVPVTEIEWHSDDALPFPLCISSQIGTDYYEDVSIARGNIVLADHGRTLEAEEIGYVPYPDPALSRTSPPRDSFCQGRRELPTPPRFRPRLKHGPLTHAASFDSSQPPASAESAQSWSMKTPLAAIFLREAGNGNGVWLPKRDLLNSSPDDRHFVVELADDGVAYLRFGDERFGSRPPAGTRFLATYRVGNGTNGNVGADSLGHLVSADPALTTEVSDPKIVAVRNPLGASGGIEPESIEQVRQNAPSAFRVQERAVTPQDYADAAKRCGLDIQRAAATFRWTGSWRTVFLTVDRMGGKEVDEDIEKQMRTCLERFRMAGYDLEVDAPRYVSLEIEMIVCVKPTYFSSDIRQTLLEVFSNRILPDGRRGVFHPDNFTFGQTVYLSPIYAAAQAVEGVDSVEIRTFQRQRNPSTDALAAGKLELGRLEIARLDNDPNFPEHGVLNLIIKGER